ncbi:hypothetical protein BP6252_11439 [Coleophoma cylindrospora]|uniref:Uncharacterized protein n=1 Tax=Coleophoma cylindrospora TaxID=1849047 RepID=A0A3D8QJK5_9HELO|nr:hypothetical protein BP6252_11439 [Coleophoma cylindrospora]
MWCRVALAVLAVGILPNVQGQNHPEANDLQSLLTTISLCRIGQVCPTPSTTSTSISTRSSLSPVLPTSSSVALIPTSKSHLTSTSSPVPPITSSSTSTSSINSMPGSDSLVITTVFTQPSDCTASDLITQIAPDSELWQNIIQPVPTATFTSCYPSQFYSSLIASASGTLLPPFRALVCPNDWETYNLNTTYIICCPAKYGLYLPHGHNVERPGLGAICTLDFWPDVLMDITRYDRTTLVTTDYTSAAQNGTIVLAYAFDGIAATATDVHTEPTFAGLFTTVSITAMPAATTTPPASATSPSSSATSAPSSTIFMSSGTLNRPITPLLSIFSSICQRLFRLV